MTVVKPRKKRPTKKPAAKATKTQRTLVALVLDTSGSMSEMREQAIGLFNQQRDAIVDGAKKAGKTELGLVLFGESSLLDHAIVRVVHELTEPTKIPLLSKKSYVPQGWTPMRDGIGRAIAMLEQADDGKADTALLVVVVTDGMENASKEYTAAALSAKVTALQKTGRWTFDLYGCSDLDLAALKEEAGLGSVPAGNFGTYARGAAGMEQGAVMACASMDSYMGVRERGLTMMSSFAAPQPDDLEARLAKFKAGKA